MLRFIDLFAGVGGLTEGFRRAVGSNGQRFFDPLLLVDANSAARETQLKNHPQTRYLLADVAALGAKQLRDAAVLSPRESVEVLIGGPPCQGFSRLNERTRRMLDDPRNALYRKFLELVQTLEPKFVLIENVPNLLDFDGGRYLEETLAFFERAGYRVAADVLVANEFGLPQLRKRAFIAALLVGLVDATGRAYLRPLLGLFMQRSAAANAGPALASMSIYILMAAVLFVRPQGLFPARGR